MTLQLIDDVLKIDAVTAAVNYGVNKVRFPAPVPVGSRIRGSHDDNSHRAGAGHRARP